MISVEEALSLILDGMTSLEPEFVGLGDLVGRHATDDVVARITQPPFPASAMDGYAVRFDDAAKKGMKLKVIGEAPAGEPFKGEIAQGDAVRIFTGGVVPKGADHVVIQEDVVRNDNVIEIVEEQAAPRNIRPAGVDFKKGDVLAAARDRLHEMHGSLFAAANIGEISVCRKPRVAIFSNGDELKDPGAALKPGQIVNSNHYALSALCKAWGASPNYLGCASDDEETIREFFNRAKNADIIVPIGGASVGDYDYVKSAFAAEGGEFLFQKVAVRPGKPVWHGRLGGARVIGLPGNPASAIVTAALFIQPLVRRLAGESVDAQQVFETGILQEPLKENGPRESYLRGEAISGDAGAQISTAPNQDSSLLKPFASANVLIRRKPGASEGKAGDVVEFVRLR